MRMFDIGMWMTIIGIFLLVNGLMIILLAG